MDIYLVGGAVRDQLLDLPVAERDWVVVGATPELMLEQGYRQVGRDFPVYLHPETREEYALARTERKTAPGHTGFSCNSDPGVTLEEDLLRRDLTINAMARDTDGTIIDPYGGQTDLEQRCLRHVSEAFVEDPLRVLRVARFTARFADLGFNVASDTLELMRQISDSGELAQLPRERIWAEFEKALLAGSPARFLDTLEACGALDQVLPGFSRDPQRRAILAAASRHTDDPVLRYAAMLEGLPEAEARAVNDHLHAPRKYADLAMLCSRFGDDFVHLESLEAERSVQFLEQTDAFRRPERFELLLQACELAQPQAYGSRDYLLKVFEVCQAVSPARWADQNLRGREIGRQIRAERIAQVELFHGR
jgi:tRNA nucleotidyltransferase (CCA-adding enzyme)